MFEIPWGSKSKSMRATCWWRATRRILREVRHTAVYISPPRAWMFAATLSAAPKRSSCFFTSTTGTGASGEMRATSPVQYSSIIASPQTRIGLRSLINHLSSRVEDFSAFCIPPSVAGPEARFIRFNNLALKEGGQDSRIHLGAWLQPRVAALHLARHRRTVRLLKPNLVARSSLLTLLFA